MMGGVGGCGSSDQFGCPPRFEDSGLSEKLFAYMTAICSSLCARVRLGGVGGGSELEAAGVFGSLQVGSAPRLRASE